MEIRNHESRRTVLIVDDDTALRSSLEFILGIEGYEVRVYANGLDLLDSGDLPSNACLVIDHRLPDVQGMDLIEKLRTRGIVTPAILITTNPNQALRRRAERAHVAIVEKPLITGALFQAIEAAFR
jgi:two-component system, LuxR family, response regulator FixJ